MFWRFIIVIWIIALLFFLGVIFADDLFIVIQKFWSMDEASLKKLVSMGKLIGMLVTSIAFIVTVLKLVFNYLLGKKSKSEASTNEGTIFNKEVSIKGDFVQGHKVVKGGKSDVE